MTEPATRLFVIPASEAPVAVIFRRGPSRWYHVMRWDMQDDTITHGAWLRGRIYERASDISPDGELLLCHIHQGSRAGTRFTQSWTAISRTPWLHALTVWPHGTTYDGGGRFVGARSVMLRSRSESLEDFPPDGLEVTHGEPAEHAAGQEVADADWCGRDHNNRVIFTRGGRVYRRVGNADYCIADVAWLEPNPQPAPDWARRPL